MASNWKATMGALGYALNLFACLAGGWIGILGMANAPAQSADWWYWTLLLLICGVTLPFELHEEPRLRQLLGTVLLVWMCGLAAVVSAWWQKIGVVAAGVLVLAVAWLPYRRLRSHNGSAQMVVVIAAWVVCAAGWQAGWLPEGVPSAQAFFESPLFVAIFWLNATIGRIIVWRMKCRGHHVDPSTGEVIDRDGRVVPR